MISIIGAGRVGSALAFLVAQHGLDDIVLYNRTKTKALGETLDIVNAIPEKSIIEVTGTDDISAIKNSNVIVITASSGVLKDDRNELLPANVPIITEISKNIRKYADNAKVIAVTNPVDIITYQIQKQTEFTRGQVIGMGSGLDSERFRFLLARELTTKQGYVEGMVIGEHGPSMVPIFSQAKHLGKKINLDEKTCEKVSYMVKNYWRDLIAYKGASVFGAAKNTFDLVRAIVEKREYQTSVSTVLDGQYGLYDISIGVPVTIGQGGVEEIVKMELDTKETQFLMESAERINEGIRILNGLLK